MDKRDVSADQVGAAARKAGIRMLPSIGKPVPIGRFLPRIRGRFFQYSHKLSVDLAPGEIILLGDGLCSIFTQSVQQLAASP